MVRKILKECKLMKFFKDRKKDYIVLGLLSFIALWAVMSLFWLTHNYDNMNIDEILYVITNPLGDSGGGLLKSYIITAVLIPLVIAADVLVALFFLKGDGRYKKYKIGMSAVSCMLIFLSLLYFGNRTHIIDYITNNNTNSDFIENNYVDPSTAKIEFPDQKRNLIFIYLESMETSFTDASLGGGVDHNLIPELSQMAIDNEDFSGDSSTLNGINQMPGTSWTMAAIFASATGLPLSLDVDDNSMGTESSFFPEMTALGDILEDQGYRQIFQLGSNASFGGRATFLTDHGNFEFRDYENAKETGTIPEDYNVNWGYEDFKLFEFAKDTLNEVSKSDQPFNLTLITVDTHQPGGFMCEKCEDENDFKYYNTLTCTSRRMGEFIGWLTEQDFYENTTVVIMGDHITMASGVSDKLNPDCDRKMYTCIMNPASTVEDKTRRREYTTFDIMPTTLAALGAKIDGERLALGTNLFSSVDTLSEKFGIEKESAELEKKSKFLSDLESFDEDTERAIELFSDAAPPEEVKINRKTGEDDTLTIRTADLSKYEEDNVIQDVRVKLWYYDKGEYIHMWYPLEPDGKGYWEGEFPLKDYAAAEELNYQLLIDIEGAPYVNLGKEGSIKMK